MYCEMVLDRSESTISIFSRFTYSNRVSGVHSRTGSLRPRVGLDLEVKIKSSALIEQGITVS
jgi:hypothetical protein